MGKKKLLYSILFTGVGIMLAVILLFSKEKQEGIPTFRERHGSLALSGEWLNTKKVIEGLLAQLRKNPDDYKAMLQLAQAYIQEARITGDHAYYDKASLELLDRILAKEKNNFDARCCKATVLLSQHHFTEALEEAKTAQKLNEHSAFIYGLLCDAQLELGNYDEAVKMSDKMISMRPDIRSYSRVSYLREIHGDMPGAIEAMKLAVAAGYPGLEQTEWSRMILAHLYENTGMPDSAEQQYKIALAERPDYAFAVAGLGRAARMKGNFKEAIAQYEKAKDMIIEYAFSDDLTDLYLLNNEKAKSAASAEKVIAMLGPGSDDESEEGHGHYADRELAYAYLKTGNTDKALEHALTEYGRRPMNIDACEALAWVCYKRSEFAEANKLINTAMRTNSQNPVLLCRAGLIKIKAGEQAAGIALVKKAAELNPFMDPLLKKEAAPYLASK
ncbi:MAG: hypothetical protein FD123_2582 [Bacteroidetes bacterium]|nr:MAG: hypothetical protein FD123_2582 [Bacteroidota bacterium]